MTEPNTYNHKFTCEMCGITVFRQMNVGTTTLPTCCSATCKNKAKRHRKSAVKQALAAMPTLDPLYGMSKLEKQLYQLAQENRQPSTVDERNYRTHGGYKAPKPAPAKTRYSEFEVFCPHPYKLPYRTFEEAQAFIDMTHNNDEHLAPYRCKCGGVHIGHSYPRNHPLHPANRNRPARSSR